jgi:hypothetical protein
VERSREGFRIDVFNSHGEEVSQISREVPPLRVTESDRRAALELLKGDPFVKQIGWEEFKRFSKLIFPDMFPPIQNIVVDQDRILVQTFKTRGSDESWMVLDLEGHFIREVYLPRVERTSFMAHLMGVTRFAIHGGFFYHLNEEEETETWEIRVLPI